MTEKKKIPFFPLIQKSFENIHCIPTDINKMSC